MTEFFTEIQGAAVLKHGLLGRYLQIFASKVGSTSRGRLVYYLDGYAGPGAYSDGNPGSPALAVETAKKLAHVRTLRGMCVEAEHDLFVQLDAALRPFAGWRAIHASVESELPALITEVGPAPLFAFLDPFGVGLPLDSVVSVLDRGVGTGTRHTTELLLNFSLPALRRYAGGHLTSQKDYPARQTFIDKADDWLGGDWWQEIWASGDPDRDHRIAAGYAARIAKEATGTWGWYVTDVADRWEGPPSYYLILLTRHPDGLWYFNEALSRARDIDFKEFCIRQGEHQPLDMSPSWVEAIRAEVEREMGKSASLDITLDLLHATQTLGYARETHVRQALRRLHSDGVIQAVPRGSLQGATIGRAD